MTEIFATFHKAEETMPGLLSNGLSSKLVLFIFSGNVYFGYYGRRYKDKDGDSAWCDSSGKAITQSSKVLWADIDDEISYSRAIARES